ncbi:hypothetical protein HKBW3S43_01866, partial [Candidatus Hakubella thermalkaliphila]
PPLSLGILASLTPDDVEISLTDENLQEIDFQEKVDLVAITTMTAAAPPDPTRSPKSSVLMGPGLSWVEFIPVRFRKRQLTRLMPYASERQRTTGPNSLKTLRGDN